MDTQTKSPEETGEYRCPHCGNTETFTGIDARGYPGDDCACGKDVCECHTELRQAFEVLPDGDPDYAPFTGGGRGAQIGAYTTILCGECAGSASNCWRAARGEGGRGWQSACFSYLIASAVRAGTSRRTWPP